MRRLEELLKSYLLIHCTRVSVEHRSPPSVWRRLAPVAEPTEGHYEAVRQAVTTDPERRGLHGHPHLLKTSNCIYQGLMSTGFFRTFRAPSSDTGEPLKVQPPGSLLCRSRFSFGAEIPTRPSLASRDPAEPRECDQQSSSCWRASKPFCAVRTENPSNSSNLDMACNTRAFSSTTRILAFGG